MNMLSCILDVLLYQTSKNLIKWKEDDVSCDSDYCFEAILVPETQTGDPITISLEYRPFLPSEFWPLKKIESFLLTVDQIEVISEWESNLDSYDKFKDLFISVRNQIKKRGDILSRSMKHLDLRTLERKNWAVSRKLIERETQEILKGDTEDYSHLVETTRKRLVDKYEEAGFTITG